MLRRIRTAAAMVACAAFLVQGRALAETVTILHVNDSHSHLDAVGPKDANLDGTLGGLAKAATLIRQLRAAEPNPMFLHAGDLFQGDSYFNATLGTVELQRLQQLGLDAMAIGNHELAFTADPLLGALFTAFTSPDFQPPPAFLSANLELSGLPLLGAFIQPRMVKQVGNLRVGIFGLVTPSAGNLHPEPVIVLGRNPDGSEDFSTILSVASEQVAKLRGEGKADVVICLSHLGIVDDLSLAAKVPGVDAVIGGHDHIALTDAVLVPSEVVAGKQVPVVQAGEFYEHVGRLHLTVEAGAVQFKDYDLVPVDAAVERDSIVGAWVQGVQVAINAAFGHDLFHTPVAFAPRDLSHRALPGKAQRDTAVGNLVTDALRGAVPGADCALTVDGFVPDDIARGIVVGDDLFRTVSDGFDPFAAAFPGRGFRLFAIDIRGAVLAAALENVLSIGGDFTPQVSGLRIVFDSRNGRLKNVLVGGEKLDPARLYTAVVNYGVVQGLTQLGVPLEAKRQLDVFEIDALLAYAAAHRVLTAAPEGRVLDVAPARPR